MITQAEYRELYEADMLQRAAAATTDVWEEVLPADRPAWEVNVPEDFAQFIEITTATNGSRPLIEVVRAIMDQQLAWKYRGIAAMMAARRGIPAPEWPVKVEA
jgi:hypothetical protein